MKEAFRKFSHSKSYRVAADIFLVLLGCALYGFGDAVFLTPWSVISGGVASVGILLDHLFEPMLHFSIADIVVAVMQVGLWVLGLAIMGKKYSLKTALAMVAYPLFYALFYRLKIGDAMGFREIYPKEGEFQAANLVLCAVCGGILDGMGVALAYLGYSSTGGFNVVSSILAKYTSLKEDVSSFLIDATLILLSALIRFNEAHIWLNCLGGILSALVCSMAIQFIYINADRYLIVDIVSEKCEDIAKYVFDDLDHSVTYFDAVGGYTGEKRKLMRVIINKSEEVDLTHEIAKIDPVAFVSITKAKSINGEGFAPFPTRRPSKKKKKVDESSSEQDDAK